MVSVPLITLSDFIYLLFVQLSLNALHPPTVVTSCIPAARTQSIEKCQHFLL